MLQYWESAASDCAVELSCAETAICCIPAFSFSFFIYKVWSELLSNCLNLRNQIICVPSKSRLSPVKHLLICSQLVVTQILSSVIFITSQWAVQGVELSTAALVLLFRSLYLFSLSFLSKLLYFIMSAGINILQSPFYVCLDAIFASVILYLALVSLSSFESSVLQNSLYSSLDLCFDPVLSLKEFSLIHLPYFTLYWQNQYPAVVHALPSDYWKICSIFCMIFSPSWHSKFIHFHGFSVYCLCGILSADPFVQ